MKSERNRKSVKLPPKGEVVEVIAKSIDFDCVASCESSDYKDVEFRVEGLFSGEKAKVRVSALSQHHLRIFADAEELLESQNRRKSIPCLHHESIARQGCSGCSLMPLEDEAQIDEKLKALTSLGIEVNKVVRAPKPLGYRHVSRRVVMRRREEVLFGSFMRGSHEVAKMDNCLVDHPAITRVAGALLRAANDRQIDVYNERRCYNGLRYIWFKTDGQKVFCTLVTGENPVVSRWRELVDAVDELSAAAICTQAGSGNSLRGDSLQVLKGTLPKGGDWLGFSQPNRQLAGTMYSDLLVDESGESVTGELAFDLYSGSGELTRRMSPSFANVTAVESHRESAKSLGIDPAKVEDFLAANRKKPDFVVANPPRKGLGKEVCDKLLASGAARIHLMSCGPKGFIRDLEQLKSGYKIESMTMYDTLPQTPHLELIARLIPLL